MQKKKKSLSISLVILFFTAFTLGSAAHAQQDDEDVFQLEEITVTAEKRESDLQKTPLAISAISGDSLVKEQVNQMYELQKIVPEMDIFVGGAAMTVISIRGVDAGDWSAASEQPNMVHLNGAVITRNNALENLFYDVERVEVLKGPQGTLYGRGASAGVINIITRKPMIDTFGGNAEAEYGNFNLMRAEGAVNLPIGDTMAMRIAYRSLKRDGYYEDTDMNNNDTRSMRLSMLWEPNNSSSLLLSTDYQYSNIHPMGANQYFGTFGNLMILNPPDTPWRNYDVYGDTQDGDYTKNTHWGIMAQYDLDLDFATATVQASHRSLNEDRASNMVFRAFVPTAFDNNFDAIGGMFITVGPFPFDVLFRSHWNSLEARLASNSTEPLKWIIGGFIYNEKIIDHSSGFMNYITDPLEKDSYAFFGEATWTPSMLNRLHLTGGIRATYDSASIIVDDEPPIDDPPLGPATEADWNKTTYKINVSYDLTEENMVYGQFATGFKAGYISSSKSIADPEILNAFEIGSKNLFFNNRLQVNMDAYYYDYKNYQEFFSVSTCKVDVNNDNVCEDWDGNGIAGDTADLDTRTTTVTPGGAKQKGASLALKWLITANARLNASVAYQRNRYETYDVASAVLAQYPEAINAYDPAPGIPAGDVSGRRFGPAPWRGRVAYTHTFDIGSDTLELTGTLLYEGKGLEQIMEINTESEYTLPGREAYWLGDFSAIYTSSYGMPPGMSWHARVWCNNVWNSKKQAAISYEDMVNNEYIFAPRSGYITSGFMGDSFVLPRTFGIAIGVNW